MSLAGLNPAVLSLVLFFVVPGFIAIRAFDLVVPAERRNFSQALIDTIAYSFVNLAVFGTPFLLLMNAAAGWHPAVYWILLYVLTIFIAFGSPLMIAYWYYVARTEGFLVGKASHPQPTAWDFLFDSGKLYWVKFYLKNGEQIGGLYGGSSFVSSFPATQQIYVEELYALDDDGVFSDEPLKKTAGAIVNREDCDYIEFLVFEYPPDPETSGEEEPERLHERWYLKWVRDGIRLLAGAG